MALVFGAAGQLSAQVAGTAVLLKNDRVLEGQVSLRGNIYQVKVGENSKVSLPAEQVAFVGSSMREVYEYKKAQIETWLPGDHFQMTRWCLLHGLADEATLHYEKVAEKHAADPRVVQLRLQLEKKLLELPGFREFLGLKPKPVQRDSAVVTASAVESAGQGVSSQDANAVTAGGVSVAATVMHPEIAAVFSRKIQPILVNRCSQAACHGAFAKNKLVLHEPYARAYAKMSEKNLASVLKQVSANENEISPLLKYASSPHGLQRQAAISVTETQLLTELRNWIQFIQNPVVSAVAQDVPEGQSRVAQARAQQFVPYSPAVILTPYGSRRPNPVPPGAMGLPQNPSASADLPSGKLNRGNRPARGVFPEGNSPTSSEIDDLDRQLRQLLGEPPPAKMDPFDPEEFNRQIREQS